MKQLIFLLFISIASSSFAQQADMSKKSFTVLYERGQSFSAAFPNDDRMKLFEDKSGSPIYKTYFKLSVAGDESLYEPSENNGEFNKFAEIPGDDNIVYMNNYSDTITVSKTVFGESFVVKIPKSTRIVWKLTDEKKKVAGYDCVKALGVLYDSINVTAFFCKDFESDAGPESFTGLPGLILAVMIPGEHISWVASKVDFSGKVDQVKPPTKGKKITGSELFKLVNDKVFPIPRYGSFLGKRAFF